MDYKPQTQKTDRSKSVEIVSPNQKIPYGFKLELRYVLRSSPLRKFLFWFTLMAGFIIYQMFLFPDQPRSENMKLLFIISFLLIPYCLGEYTWQVQANFFCGVWTKPIQLMDLLYNKYLLYNLLSLVNVLLLVPLVVMGKIDCMLLISTFIYSTGFVHGLILTNVIIVKTRGKLDASTFRNYHNISIAACIYSLLVSGLGVGIYLCVLSTLDHVFAYLFLSIIGLLSFFTSKLWLSIIIKFFNMRRYSIMDGFRKS